MVLTDSGLPGKQYTQNIDPDRVLEEICLARYNERRRLSSELHDGVVQWMVGALYRIRAFRQEGRPSPAEELTGELVNIEGTLQKSVRELRRIIANLRPLPLEELGLLSALRQAAAALADDGITCCLELGEPLPELTPAEERATLGIVQEALTNIRKHSGACHVHLSLRCHDGTVSVLVTDNGRGFNPQELAAGRLLRGHIGLLSMKDHAELIGARLSLDSCPGEGTSVSLAFRPASLCRPSRDPGGECVV